jgi:hypothetical protein
MNDLDSLKRKMLGTKTIMGFDAVLNIDLETANKLIKKQYDDLPEESKDFAKKEPIELKIDSYNITVSKIIKGDLVEKDFLSVKKLVLTQLKFDTPMFSFHKNQTSEKGLCSLEMKLDGIIQHHEVSCIIKEEDKDWIPQLEKNLIKHQDCTNTKIEVKVKEGIATVIGFTKPKKIKGNNQKLNADVPLAEVSGEIDSKKDVKLDFAKGSFSTSNISNLPIVEADINIVIKKFFIDNDFKFIITSLVFKNKTDVFYLTPNSFKITTKTSNVKKNGKILQLFIFCGDNKYKDNIDLSIASVTEPIPEGYDISLFISNKNLFKNIIPNLKQYDKDGKEKTGNNKLSFKTKGGGNNISENYYCSVNIDIPIGGTPLALIESGSHSYDDYYAKDDEVLSLDLQFKNANKGATAYEIGMLNMSFDTKSDYVYTRHSHFDPTMTPDPDTYNNYTIKDVKINLNASIPFTIDTKEKQQYIHSEIKTNNLSIYSTVPSESYLCKKAEFSEKVQKSINEKTPKEIKEAINGISFQEISVFALENILFPASQEFNLEDVSVPCDMLIVGKLIDK